jgi:hypothetical protein
MSKFIKKKNPGSLKRATKYGSLIGGGQDSYSEHLLQFVPATVIDVIINAQSPAYSEVGDINCILASPTVENYNISQGTSRIKYKPLLRGMCDTPVKGDPVLLLTLGGGTTKSHYYLGPLNGNSNSPNYNIDPLNTRVNYTADQAETKDRKQNLRDRYNIPKNFILSPISRLQKVFKPNLDNPSGYKIGEKGSIAQVDTHGDYQIEGRYGNGIRIGSRSSYPLLFIHNGRNAKIPFETFYDNSVIGMTTAGSLSQHYGGFQLSSDSIEDNVRKIFGTDTESDEMFGSFNYSFGSRPDLEDIPSVAGQIYMGSDRIVFNARKSTITMSSFKSIDLGADKFTVNTKNETIIESKNIYLGKEAKQKQLEGEPEEKQPLVLGYKLKQWLDKLMDVLIKSHALIQGVPVPLADEMALPLRPEFEKLKAEIETPEFWSEYHFIENNEQKSD